MANQVYVTRHEDVQEHLEKGYTCVALACDEYGNPRAILAPPAESATGIPNTEYKTYTVDQVCSAMYQYSDYLDVCSESETVPITPFKFLESLNS